MIIIGYPGVGKTQLAAWHYNDYLDVDSSKFIFCGVRPSNWAECCVKMAEDLSKQGYDVFVNSYKEIRDLLEKSEERVVAVYPSLELKEPWVNRLKERFETEPSSANYNAWKRAEQHYEEDINDILADPFQVITIEHMGYDLEELIINETGMLGSQEIQLPL